MTKAKTLLFGAHMSIAGGLYRSIERGESIGCTAIQIFTKNNRQWYAKPLAQDEIDMFKMSRKNSSIASIIAHATYLINIASANKDLEHKSINALSDELDRCNKLEIPYLVLHPGSYTQGDKQKSLIQIAHNIDQVLERAEGKTSILLETMAGQGSSLCSSFEEIAHVIDLSRHKSKLGVCFDTCHAFAAGYDFRVKEDYRAMWELFDKTIGLNKLHAMHINDSKTECGARVDRHTDIGKGKLGLEAFRLLFNDKRFIDIPKILETPHKVTEDFIPNMKTIHELILNDV